MTSKQTLVILVANYFEQCSGGAELQAYYLAETAKNNHWDVHYIFISNGDPYKNSLGITLHPIKKSKLAAKLGNIKYVYLFQIWRRLYQINPDAVYQRAASSLSGIANLYASLNSKKMVFHIAHDNGVIPIKLNWRSFFQVPELLLKKSGLKRSTTIIAQTNYQAQKFLKTYGRAVTRVIPNAHPEPETLQVKNKTLSIVWIANMKPIKQPEIFIELAAELKKTHDVDCTMIGRIDNYSDTIRKAVNEGYIKALGEISNDKVNELLEKSHILINTSISEGFSNTFIQAWMRGTPVVSLHVNPDNLFSTQNIGFCSMDFNGLVRDVSRLLKNENDILNSMAASSIEYAHKHHSINNMHELLKEFSK